MSNKTKVFVLTFLTYASVHTMRMAYSFSKAHIKLTFGISSLSLGLMDALIFIALALGTFFRYSLLQNKNLALLCLKTSIPTALSFSLVPLASLYFEQNSQFIPSYFKHIFLILSLGLFGFFQFYFFPALLTIFSRYFSPQKDGSWVGIWSSKSNVGNMVGFFLANFLVYQIHCKWQIVMILSSIFHISIALLLNWMIQDDDDEQGQTISTNYFIQYLKLTWKKREFKLYIFSFSFFKAILYSYEFWTPSFLSHNGYANFSGYVPMIFDVSTLLGSYLMGKLYQQKYNGSVNNELKCIGNYKFFIASIFIIFISIFYVLCRPNIVLYFGLAVLMGISLGGIYNALQNNEILKYTSNDAKETDMFSTINIGIGCILVGLFQLAIGFLVHFSNYPNKINSQNKNQTKHSNHSMIYVVIVILAIIAMVLTFMRADQLRKDLSSKKIQEYQQKIEQKTFEETIIIGQQNI